MTTTATEFEKGQMVRINFTDQYGHDRTETAEVFEVDATGVRATYMAYGEDHYQWVPFDKATLLAARVTHGFSCYDDFATMEEALQFAAERAREVERDPLCRKVRILSLDPEQRSKKWGIFRELLEVERPGV